MARPVLLLLVSALLAGNVSAQAGSVLDEGVSGPRLEFARRLSEAEANPLGLARPWETTRGHQDLLRFYADRGYTSVWDGGARAQFREFLDALRTAAKEGLDPDDYELDRLDADWEALMLGSEGDPELLPREFELVHAALTVTRHLARGRVDTSAVALVWDLPRRTVDAPAVVARGLAGGNLVAEIAGAAPPEPAYAALRDELDRYRELAAAGGWPMIPGTGTMRPEDDPDSLRVVRLEERLVAEGYLTYAIGDGWLTPRVQDAVARFQARHGLDVDGLAGRTTLAEMNRSAEERARQIELNLERLRWAADAPPRRGVRINVADYRLEAFDADTVVVSMRVGVGRSGWATPVFTDTMTYLVANPWWYVPESVARKTLLPKILADSTYLAINGYEVLPGWGGEHAPIDPAIIEWHQLPPGRMPYKLRQRPGKANALGRVKFMFPNPYHIYLHDTSDRSTFVKSVRGVSHGCIRIENPDALTAFVLGPEALAPDGRFTRAAESGEQKVIPLAERIPVQIRYATAWVDRDGTLQFRRDIYDVDRDLDRALRGMPPVVAERE